MPQQAFSNMAGTAARRPLKQTGGRGYKTPVGLDTLLRIEVIRAPKP